VRRQRASLRRLSAQKRLPVRAASDLITRLQRLVGTLKKRYGALPVPPSDAFALFVWLVLSGHSTPKKSGAAFKGLKRIGALTPDGMWNASPKALAESVELAGPFGQYRLLALRKGIQLFRHDPELPAALRESVPAGLKRMKGLPRMSGDGPAYLMLLFAGGHAVLPVDARVARVTTRLGYGEWMDKFPKTAKSVRQAVAQDLEDRIAAYRDAYIYLEHHGATTCVQTDPECDECPLLMECPFGRASIRA
jgi:endonuclease III